MSILYQLGKVKSDIALRVYADRLCELKPPTSKAINLIRDWEENRKQLIAYRDGEQEFPTAEELNRIARQAREASETAPYSRRKYIEMKIAHYLGLPDLSKASLKSLTNSED